MKIAIMQPYLFSYIGYFQLIKAVDKFVIYDDVNYITHGWINRNKILINNKAHLFIISCKKRSQHKLINEIDISFDLKAKDKLIKTFERAYKKAPYYKNISILIKDLLEYRDKNLSNFLTNLIKHICSYLEINTTIYRSSEKHKNNKGMGKADRLIEITKEEGANHYINPMGGEFLYDKDYFIQKGVRLSFLLPKIPEYRQFSDKFIPNLSIIDILMFNSKTDILKMLDDYRLL